MEGALVRYRVMTFIVGSALIVLVFLGVPLQVWGHFDLVAKVEGTIHGYLYLVYLFTAAGRGTAGALAPGSHPRRGALRVRALPGIHRRAPGLPADATGVDHRPVGSVRRGGRRRRGDR